jgi:hypothetical protein
MFAEIDSHRLLVAADPQPDRLVRDPETIPMAMMDWAMVAMTFSRPPVRHGTRPSPAS